MTSHDRLSERIQELTLARFGEFEQELRRQSALAEREEQRQQERLSRRTEFVASAGIDRERYAAATAADDGAEEEDLAAFLTEARSGLADRTSQREADAQDVAARTAVLEEAGEQVVPPHTSSIFAPDIRALSDVGELNWVKGPEDSGWVFPDDPAQIRIKAFQHYPNALCWSPEAPAPEFAAHFAFVPVVTATHDLTASMAFHGFYIVRSDYRIWNCRSAEVDVTAQMNVRQYSSSGWHDFPLLHVWKRNAELHVSYDRTHEFFYRAALRAGDPVVVTVRGRVRAHAHGGGAYAEVNFADGTANYIEPLMMSVRHY